MDMFIRFPGDRVGDAVLRQDTYMDRYSVVCLCTEPVANGHETRCATLTSGCSIMWNHSATLILLLTPLIDICARSSYTAGSKCAV